MMQDQSAVIATLPEVTNLVNNLLILLSPKEKHIIENRYSLNNKAHATLEKIGKEFGVTRERIRQIEKNALKKLARNVVNTKLHVINQYGNHIIHKYDGVVHEDTLVSEILALVNGSAPLEVSGIKLSLELDSNIERSPNTIHYFPYFKLKTIEQNEIINVCDHTMEHLTQCKEVIAIEALLEALEKRTSKKYAKQFVLSCLALDRRLKIVRKGIGLATWRHINPRTLRDKIHYTLKESQKPLHYVEIANRIAASNFDKKNINVQAVHNELIRDELFVLIGRGIYALRTWGYNDGTVAEVIAEILKDSGPLDREAIIVEVLKKRQVKRITIVLNLKNKPLFDRVGRNVYALKKV